MPSGWVMRLASFPAEDEVEVAEGFVDGVEEGEAGVDGGDVEDFVAVGIFEAEAGGWRWG